MDHANHTADIVLGLSLLLLLASGVLALAKRIHLPFTILLVIVGMLVAQLAPHLPSGVARVLDFHLGPALILYVFLPSLIFESASHLDPRQLRDNIVPILVMAVPGLLISTLIIGALVAALTAVPFIAALVLGAILSATDPVAVVALFRQLGAPQRLLVLVEGESLFNDATAIVAAKILLGVAVAGTISPALVGAATVEFALVFAGGVSVGAVLAVTAGLLLGTVRENQAIEISILTTLAYLSFLIAEEVFHVSGVMAAVAAGITMGGWGRSKISPGIVDYIDRFWTYVAFVAEALIFLLVGLAIDFAELVRHFDVLLVVIGAMLLSRALVIYGLVPALSLLPGSEPIGGGYKTVMYWGGLRGAVALAVVLSLGSFAWADAFTSVVMGAVLFTLVVQGLTVEPLMRLLGLDQPSAADRFACDEAQVESGLEAVARIPELGAGGLFSAAIAQRIEQRHRKSIDAIRERMTAVRANDIDPTEARRLLWLRCLATERVAYYEMYSRHHIDEGAFRALDHATATRIDAIWHFGHRAPSKEGSSRRPLKGVIDRLPRSLRRLVHTRSVAREYVKSWAEFQACNRVLNLLAELRRIATLEPSLIEEVAGAYQHHKAVLTERLDGWAAQFPEFVKTMQERLAERLLLRVEQEGIAERIRSGILPHGIGDHLLEALDDRIRTLGIANAAALEIDPLELLRRVPFFAGLAETDIQRIVEHLSPVTVAPGEDVIREGEAGSRMYFIARGVVRVLRSGGGPEREVATLLAGDFFGEMALLGDEVRTATCRAKTACALYELGRVQVEAVESLCPALGVSLRAAAAARSALT